MRPPRIRDCTSRKKAITGTAITVEPAITPPQSVPLAPWLNAWSHTGSVWLAGRFMITSAKMNSFQAWMKPKTPVATSPGAISGNVTAANAHSREHPSTIAASSSSTGTPATNPRSVQIVKGSTKTR